MVDLALRGRTVSRSLMLHDAGQLGQGKPMPGVARLSLSGAYGIFDVEIPMRLRQTNDPAAGSPPEPLRATYGDGRTSSRPVGRAGLAQLRAAFEAEGSDGVFRVLEAEYRLLAPEDAQIEVAPVNQGQSVSIGITGKDQGHVTAVLDRDQGAVFARVFEGLFSDAPIVERRAIVTTAPENPAAQMLGSEIRFSRQAVLPKGYAVVEQMPTVELGRVGFNLDMDRGVRRVHLENTGPRL